MGISPLARLNFSTPEKSMQNAFVGSFDERMRDEHLNQTLFFGLDYARTSIEAWRQRYNNLRPHSSIGKMPPAIFAST